MSITKFSRLHPFIHRCQTQKVWFAAIAAAVILLAQPGTIHAQAYGEGQYGGSIYNGGATTSTPTPTPSVTSVPTPTPSSKPGHGGPTPTPIPPTPTDQEESSSSASPSATPVIGHTGDNNDQGGNDQGNNGSNQPQQGQPGLLQTIASVLGNVGSAIPTPIVSAAHGLVKGVHILATDIITHPSQSASLVAASASVAAPAAVPLAESLPYLQWRNIFSIVGLFFRRRRQPWGVVYDATTKEPLDPVILTLTDSKGKQMQTVSDIYGRYAFVVEPGTYRLKAEKSNYQFPSAMLAGHTADEVYDDLYFGKLIAVSNASLLNANIPMDPVGSDWNQAEKQRMGILHNRALWGAISLVLFYGGLAWSIYLFVQHQTLLNSIILLIYAIILIGQTIFRRRGSAGIVRDTDGHPIRGAVIRLHNLVVPQLGYPPVVTKSSGQYSFLVNHGSYQVTAEVKGPDNAYQQVASSPKLDIEKSSGLVKPNLTVGQK